MLTRAPPPESPAYAGAPINTATVIAPENETPHTHTRIPRPLRIPREGWGATARHQPRLTLPYNHKDGTETANPAQTSRLPADTYFASAPNGTIYVGIDIKPRYALTVWQHKNDMIVRRVHIHARCSRSRLV